MAFDDSLWTTASSDHEAETQARRLLEAKVSAAQVWPFLAMATDRSGFEHRLALVREHIEDAIDADLREPVVASLRSDHELMLSGPSRRTASLKWANGDMVEAQRDGENAEDEEDSDEEGDAIERTSARSVEFSTDLWAGLDTAPAPLAHQSSLHRRTAHRAPRTARYFDEGSGTWRALANNATTTEENPDYFVGRGPEMGPNTPGPDSTPPPDPDSNLIMQRYMAPEGQWHEDGTWLERPMNFGNFGYSTPGQRPAQPPVPGPAPSAPRTAAGPSDGTLQWDNHDSGIFGADPQSGEIHAVVNQHPDGPAMLHYYPRGERDSSRVMRVSHDDLDSAAEMAESLHVRHHDERNRMGGSQFAGPLTEHTGVAQDFGSWQDAPANPAFFSGGPEGVGGAPSGPPPISGNPGMGPASYAPPNEPISTRMDWFQQMTGNPQPAGETDSNGREAENFRPKARRSWGAIGVDSTPGGPVAQQMAEQNGGGRHEMGGGGETERKGGPINGNTPTPGGPDTPLSGPGSNVPTPSASPGAPTGGGAVEGIGPGAPPPGAPGAPGAPAPGTPAGPTNGGMNPGDVSSKVISFLRLADQGPSADLIARYDRSTTGPVPEHLAAENAQMLADARARRARGAPAEEPGPLTRRLAFDGGGMDSLTSNVPQAGLNPNTSGDMGGAAPQGSQDAGGFQSMPNPMDGSGSPQVPQSTRPAQTPGTDMNTPMPDVAKTGSWFFSVQANRWVQAEGPSKAISTVDDPSGVGDEFSESAYENAFVQRPRQDVKNRRPNTPQNPGSRSPIPTVSSPGPQNEEDER